MRFGINLWGVYSSVVEDPKGFVDAVKAMGFRYIEPCAVIGKEPERAPQFMGKERLS